MNINDSNGTNSTQPNPPVFNLPSIILAIGAFLIAIHAIRIWALDAEQDRMAIIALSFIPARFENLIGDPWPLAVYWSPLTYSFLHADWTHLGVNLLWTAAFGSIVVRRWGVRRFLVLWVVGSLAGALAHFTAHQGELIPTIGASAAVSAFMGAAARFAFPPGGPFGRDVSQLPADSILQTFSNRQALAFVGIWFLINFLFGAGIVNIAGEGTVIAWEAHIGGFLAGFLLFAWFDRWS